VARGDTACPALVRNFVRRVFEGRAPARALLRHDPFGGGGGGDGGGSGGGRGGGRAGGGAPSSSTPNFIRVRWFSYRFTKWGEEHGGCWWRRTLQQCAGRDFVWLFEKRGKGEPVQL
jgi:hypothetical protein